MTARPYRPTIGLEVHVQLATRTKIFCGCSTAFGAPPNTQVCPVCLGLPGALPVFNRKVLHFAIKAALALECEMAGTMKFDRKSYFYPDLPKNFQISQYDLPVASNGRLEFPEGPVTKAVRIKRVHLEEDAGKLIHMDEEEASLVDYNRSGTPLLEIVSEPDITSADEAYEYLTALKAILKYLEISDCNMEEGSLRCDANVSIRPEGVTPLGVKTELKNMNSFKGVRLALRHEIERQRDVLKGGGEITQETRLWNEAEARTYSMRSKEEAFDYRYFPEPDLVPFAIDRKLVDKIAATLPELPAQRLERLMNECGLPPSLAGLIVNDRETADYFEESFKIYKNGQAIANWIFGDILAELNKRNVSIKTLGVKPKDLAAMVRMIDDNVITGKIAKQILPEMIDTGRPPAELVESMGLSQIKDAGELEMIAAEVITANPKVADDYRNGKKAALTFLMGQFMKATKGKANPKLANELLKKKLEPK